MLFHPFRSILGHPSALLGMFQHPCDGFCEYPCVSRLDQHSGYTRYYNLYRPAFIRGDDRQPGCHAFNNDLAERLRRNRRVNQQIGFLH
ncbi:hypothetical protein D3C80_1644140 [compost metagenome]